MASLGYLKAFNRELGEGIMSAFALQKRKISPRPDFVCFGISDECMLRCKMCYKWKEDIFIKPNAKTPSLKDWKNCIASLKGISQDSLQINFGGGEPFLRQDILEIASFSKGKGFKTNIASNGYLIDAALAKEIGRSGLDSIILSLDSLNPAAHDHLRGTEGAFDRVMRAIDLLEQFGRGIYKGICCVIYEKNLEEILDLAAWVEGDERINSVYFMAAMQPNNSPWDPAWQDKEEFGLLWPRDSARASSVIDELIRLKKQGYKIANQICQLEAFKLYYQYPAKFVKHTKCNMDSALHISSCGDIFLCYRWQKLGNIQEDDLAGVWNSQEAERTRADIRRCKNNCHFLLNCFFKDDYPFRVEQTKEYQ